jgi:DnaJ-class molecular chaperone
MNDDKIILTERDCPDCFGSGIYLGPYGKEFRCRTCDGLGSISDIQIDEGVI